MKSKKIFLIFIFIIITLLNTNIYAANLTSDMVTVPAAILVETKTNKLLFEKNSMQTMYPASTTKILTSIIAIESCNLNDKVTITFDAISNIPEGYTTADLVVDEILTVNELLHLTLIQSANDAANALGIYVAGSLDSFATIMNTKAYELGCRNSNFTNAYGMHDEKHYSTANDLYIIGKYAMKNQIFKEIVKKTSYTINPTNMTETERKIYNTNQLLNSEGKYYDKRATGIKTGFTTPAGSCLIFSAEDNDMEIVAVALGGIVDENGVSQLYFSTNNLINYAFENYSYRTIHKKNNYYDTITIKNATDETKELSLIFENDLTIFGEKNILNGELIPNITYNHNMLAPIKNGDIIGTISYNIMNTTYFVNIIAGNDVDKKIVLIPSVDDPSFPSFIIILLILVMLIITIFIIKINKKNKYNDIYKSLRKQ